nr:retrovirus-related Pol polyprotein from transposon TNT 1-94 [Tanacetum cinerariifolium]
MRPFGCSVTILNTLDLLGKLESKANEGFLVEYSVTSKAFRVFNTKTKKVDENLHVRFLKIKPNVAGKGPSWPFDIDSLTNSMNYIPVSVGNQTDKNVGPQDTNGNAGTQDNVNAEKKVSDQHYILMPLWSFISSTYKSSDDKAEDDKPKDDTGSKTVVEPVNQEDQAYRDALDRLMSQEKEASDAADSLSKEFEKGPACGPSYPHLDAFIPNETLLHVDQDDSQIPNLKDTAELRSTGIFTSAYDDELNTFTSPVQSVGAEADFNNMKSSIVLSPIPTHRLHIDHPKDQILRDPQSAAQTWGIAKKSSRAHALMEPKKVAQALDDESWVEAMQDELLQFSLQKVWRLIINLILSLI